MTLQEWLGSRQPAAPPELRARIASLVGGADRPAPEIAPALLEIASERMRELLGRRPADRELAFDLLAADAVVTYAFEAAAELGGSLPLLAGEGMRCLAPAGLVARDVAASAGD